MKDLYEVLIFAEIQLDHLLMTHTTRVSYLASTALRQ